MSRSNQAVQEWFSAAELADLGGVGGLPATKPGVLKLVRREGWLGRCDETRGALSRKRHGRGGGVEFHVSLLPETAQVQLLAACEPKMRPDRDSMWARWDRLPGGLKAEAQQRLEIIERVEAYQKHGMGKAAAIEAVVSQAAREARAAGRPAPFQVSTLYGWLKHIDGVAHHDRVAYLVPDYQGRTTTADCTPDAWEFYKGDYLRQSKPAHAACYRRLQRAALDNGWTIPSAKTLQRRLEAEAPPAVQTYLRHGESALDHAFPYLQRSRAGVAPMQILNLDGHTWDVMVRWPNGTISRPHALAVQDIASSKILAIRHDLTLSHHLVRLALGDTFREFGLPEVVMADNGRENTAQAIAGGQHRLRWGKTPEEEPDGLLKILGVRLLPVTPYWGQAKPIERAFRDFAHDLAKGPEFEGAYTGHNTVSKPENHGSRAIPFEEFEHIVRREIAFYNAQLGRRGIGKNGRSFDQVFAEGIGRRPAPRLTAEQLRLCLLASKPVSMDPQSGAVAVEGHRYWSPELGAVKRQKVIVRFDPERMELPAYVYSTTGRLLAEAPRMMAGTFDSASDGREHRKALRDYRRGQKLSADAVRRLSPQDVAARLAGAPAPAAMPADEKVVALNFAAPRSPEELGAPATDPTDFNAKWLAGVARLGGGG
jgi:putative transposase